MSNTPPSKTTRRDFIKTTGTLAATSALAGGGLPRAHAAENNTLQLALVGCGGGGAGGGRSALSTQNGPIVLSAMVDVFDHRLDNNYETIKKQYGDAVDVPKDKQFIEFGGYKKAMDSLTKGDIVILTTPL